jgi:HEAT repeat protein/predicted nucleic acid-binding Zn ribbon protein
MFCDKCGTTLQADQRFCSRCGKEVAGPMVGYPQRNRVREHVRLLGIFWLALSAFRLIPGLFLVAFMRHGTMSFLPPDVPFFVHGILDQLEAPEMPIRYSAAYAIGRIGSKAKAAIPALEKNLQERDELLQIASAWALVHVDPQRDGLASQCLEPLTRALKLSNPRFRSEGALTLAMLGAAAKPALPALQAIAKDPDETVRKSVADAIKKIGK